MPGLSAENSEGKTQTVRPPLLQEAPGGGRGQSAASAPLSARGVLPKITKSIERGDGWRHGWLGLPGRGKSHAAIATVNWLLETNVADCVLVLDDKGRHPQYDGTFRLNVAQLRVHPPEHDENPGIIVFRGIGARVPASPTELVGCTAEEIAAYAWELSLNPTEPVVVVVIDELLRAVKPGSFHWQGEALRRSFADGRGVGLSVMWTTQLLSRCPTEVTDLTETIGIFQLAGRSLDYAAERLKMPAHLLAVVEGLPHGHFIIWDLEVGWDGHVWKF